MVTHEGSQAFGAIPSDDHPQFECTETSAQRHHPIPIVNDLAGLGRRILQILRHDRHCARERRLVCDPVGSRVEVGEQPFVRVERVTIDSVEARVHQRPKLWCHRSTASEGRIDMHPGAVFSSDRSDVSDRVDRSRRCRADRAYDEEGHEAICHILRHCICQQVSTHGEVFIHVNAAQLFIGETGDPHPFEHRRMRLG